GRSPAAAAAGRVRRRAPPVRLRRMGGERHRGAAQYRRGGDGSDAHDAHLDDSLPGSLAEPGPARDRYITPDERGYALLALFAQIRANAPLERHKPLVAHARSWSPELSWLSNGGRPGRTGRTVRSLQRAARGFLAVPAACGAGYHPWAPCSG